VLQLGGAEVLEKVSERSELRLKTTCRNQRGEVVVDGEAKVKIMESEGSGKRRQANPKTTAEPAIFTRPMVHDGV